MNRYGIVGSNPTELEVIPYRARCKAEQYIKSLTDNLYQRHKSSPPELSPSKRGLNNMKMKKIKLWKDKYHVVVQLYDTVKEVQEITKDKSCAGMYSPEPYIIYPRLKIPLKLGTIYLAKERLGVGYITHEVLHCIFDYGHKSVFGLNDVMGFDDMESQEILCGEQGYISKEICNWLNDKKLW